MTCLTEARDESAGWCERIRDRCRREEEEEEEKKHFITFMLPLVCSPAVFPLVRR